MFLNRQGLLCDVIVLWRLTSRLIVLFVQKNVVKMNDIQVEQKNGAEPKRWGSHDTIFKLCSKRLEKLLNDQQVVSIKRRILSCTDLVAAEGRYQKSAEVLYHCKLHSLARKVSRKFRRDKLFYNWEEAIFLLQKYIFFF